MSNAVAINSGVFRSTAESDEANKSPEADFAIKVERIETDQWDNLSAQFDDIIPEQTSIFNKAHWGADNIETIVFRSGTQLIGGAVLLVKKVPFLNTGLAVLKWGPVWRRGETVSQNFTPVLQSLVEEYCLRRNLHLTILPVAHPLSTNIIREQLEKLNFTAGSSFASPARYIVNVGISEEELRTSLSQKWRYNLKKALKNEFEIEYDSSDAGLETFKALYAKMMARKQFHDSSAIDSLEEVMKNGAKSTRPHIVLVRESGVVIAGGVFSFSGDMATYMFGATQDNALRTKAGYAMHWWLAQELCRNEKIKFYDLGGNDLDDGLHQFKKGFVGKEGMIVDCPPRYHLANSLLAKFIGASVFGLKDLKSSMSRVKFRLLKKTKS